MPLELANPLSKYFAAQNAMDVDAMLACFSDGARVRDEGHDHSGRAEIRAWMEETTRKYQVTVRPQRVAREAGSVVVTAAVAGTFPGSPVDLRFRFALSGDRIAELEIAPAA